MSQKAISDRADELFNLIEKDNDGIIATFNADALIENPATVADDYQQYADTHISIGDTGGFEDRCYDQLVNVDNPTKGYLYGPFGYGKTSTAINIWHILTEKDIIAVPPFTVKSFSGIMRATYGWMRYQLETEAPGYEDRLEEIREEYLEKEIEDLAAEKLEQHKVSSDVDELVRMFEEMEQSNELELQIKPNTLIDFFDECTELALDAGFDGVVVIGDEFQQYFKSADSRQDAEAQFRDLVQDLKAGVGIRNEFGLLISMPEDTKSRLDAHAGDIINRLEDDNLAINLKNVYGQQFPKTLWDRYASLFEFEDEKYEIINEPALDAMGQISSREDLSDGPRTVIDLFRIALKHYRDKNTTFTALHLAEAYYDGEVRFQGPETKVRTAIHDALGHSTIDTDKKEQFVKLAAVFPEEGIPQDLLNEYELEAAQEAISRKVHGDVITYKAAGYTLVGVTEDDEPIRIEVELARQFWRQYDTNDVNAELAVRALANKVVIGEIFNIESSGELATWGGPVNEFELDEIGQRVYKDTIAGTFDSRYPRRDVSLAVADTANRDEITHYFLGEGFDSPDIAFNFIFKWETNGEQATSYIEEASDREFTFVLNSRKTFDGLPSGLQFLDKAMNPKEVTPFLMLAFAQFIDQNDTEFEAAEQQQIESLQKRLLNKSVQVLFDEDLINNAPIDIRRSGTHAVEELFTTQMEELYPDYETLIVSNQYERLISDYLNFLQELDTVSQRRGRTPVERKKRELADMFNLNKHSALKGRIQRQYSDLMELEEWEGEDAVVTVKLHPFEQEIVEELESGEREEIPAEEVEERAQELGYRSEEFQILTDLLGHRGIIDMNEHNALVLRETTVTKDDAQAVVEECQDLLDTIAELDSDRIPEDLADTVDEAVDRLEKLTDDDGEELEAIKVTADQHWKRRLESIGQDLHKKYRSDCEDLQERITRTQRNLIPRHVDEGIKGQVKFVGALNDIRTDIRGEYQELKQELSEIDEELDTALLDYEEPTVANAEELATRFETLQEEFDSLQEDKQDLEDRADRLQKWRTFTDSVAAVKDQITEFTQTINEDIDEKERIDEFIATVTEDLVSSPEEALSGRNAYKERLDDIQEAFDNRQKKQRDAFDEKRQTLKMILDEAAHGQSRGLDRAAFDIHNPDGSRRQLVEDFQSAYKGQVIEEAEDDLQDAQNDVEYAQIVGSDDRAERDAEQVAAEINQALQRSQQLQRQVERFIFSNIGDETDLGSEGDDLLQTANQLREDAREFLEQRTPEDEDLEELWERITDSSRIEFKELLREYYEDGQEVEPEALLQQVNELFRMNQVDIQISNRRGGGRR